MSKRKLPKKNYNVDDALDYLLASDDEVLGELDDDDDYDDNGDGNADFDVYYDEDPIAEPEDTPEVVVQEQRPKRVRLIGPINSLDSALDESHYTEYAPDIPKENLESKIDAKTYKWIKSTVRTGRPTNINVLTTRPGPSPAMRPKKTHSEIWSCFFTDDMIDDIIKHTNNKIESKLENLPDEIKQNNKYSYIKTVTKNELLAFFGFFYARGLLKQNLQETQRLFNSQIGHPIFAATMSYNRYCFLRSMIVFDDAASRSERWKTDRFAAFRDIFEKFNNNCAKNMAPDDFLAIDETLYPTRGGVSFKTYNKDKPAKYGLNFRSLGSSRHPYVYYTIPYTGKPEEVTDAHIKDTMTLVKRIVEGYETNGFNLSGTNISMDRYYTSIPIAEWLYEKKITCIATMNSNRKGLPTEMKEIKGREENSWMACKIDGGEIIINSYVVKTKSGMRNVLLLTTMEPAHYVTDDKKKKPYMYKIYDFTKGGIDIPDQRVGTYTCKVKTRKWTLVALSYVLDMARTNSQTVYKINNEKTEVDSFEFGWELAKSLVKKFMLERLQKGALPLI